METSRLCLSFMLLISCSVRQSDAGYCQKARSCSNSCYVSAKYYEGCGFLWLSRCSVYRSQLSVCYSTCYYSECCSGYIGNTCSTPICTQSCLSNAYCSYPETCSCYSGYQMLSDGRTCTDIDECASGLAGCHQDCTNTQGSYKCSCRDGYQLYYGKYCYDIDECSSGNHGCGQICTNTAGSYQCSCRAGFRLDINGKTCSDIDECTSGVAECDGLCENTDGSYYCSCDAGFVLSSDWKTCTDANECLLNNGGCDHECVNLLGSYQCKCSDGYNVQDAVACTDIDECSQGTSGCSHHCQNTDGSFVCSCDEGYELHTDNKSCLDIDDCENVVCENGGTCVDEVDHYTCSCSSGYMSDHCETDINECQMFNGGCQETCVNTVGSFYCGCFDGIELSSDGKSCLSDDNVIENCESFALAYLPEACFSLPLGVCTTEDGHRLYLKSTSQWYTKISNSSLFFTKGITFIEFDGLALPMSLQGVEVFLADNQFHLRHGTTFDYQDGEVLQNNNETPPNCREFELTDSNIFKYISCGAFLKTFLTSLQPSIPDWVRFDKASESVLAVQDLKSDLIWGRNMDQASSCKGAPVIKDSLYSVFRFESTFNMSIIGMEVNIPKPLSGRKFCLIVDICQANGGTMFFIIPEESRTMLDTFEIFKSLREEKGISILPRGFGLSLVRGISVRTQSSDLQLWNGDTLFHYTPIQRGNVWIGADTVLASGSFIADGSLDLFIEVPSINNMLTSIFYSEWNAYVSASLVLNLKFDLFGQSFTVPLHTSAALEAFMSIGGDNRNRCGEDANPPGFFFYFTLDSNPFKGIYLLDKWKTATSQTAYGFISSELKPNLIDLGDVLQADIKMVGMVLQDISLLVEDTVQDVIFRNTTSLVLIEMRSTVAQLQAVVVNSSFSLFKYQKQTIEQLWTLEVKLEHNIQEFFKETENIVLESVIDFKRKLENARAKLKQIIKRSLNNITERLIAFQKPFSEFGLKFRISIIIFSLDLGDFEIEFVSSMDSLFRCSRFSKVIQLLEGENAKRLIGRAFTEMSLNRFLSYERGQGIGGALSKDSNKFALQLQIFANMIGIKATADLFITSKGLYLYLEGNVWNIFLAQLDVSAEIGKSWLELTLRVSGRFLAQARRKRQIQTVNDSFQSSYLDGLKKAIRFVSDWASARLSQVQDRLTNAQSAFTKAQNWLEEKKTVVRNEETKFDQAVAKLDSAKEALEAAKGPFKEAVRKLEEAQRNVDNLCQIKTCDTVCIPGVRLAMCGSGWFTLPCLKWTNCMISFPNPICVAANALCYIVRAAAYVALEAAKFFVRLPMLALDIAKVAVSAAQVIVDKSRVVLLVAEGILEVAKVGLEFAKDVLEAAKLALEAVKLAIGAAADVLSLVITYGIQSVIDVRNCGFEIELSTKDLPIFDVFCEVNAFKLGWRKITFSINFKNIFQSIWNAARATIESLMNLTGNLSGRKRREVSFRASHTMHNFIRAIRSVDNSTDQSVYLYESINLTNNTFGFSYGTSTDYDHRVLLFKAKCEKTKAIYEFLRISFNSLQSVANESLQTILEIEAKINELKQFSLDTISENLTLDNAGISLEYAASDYNITEEDLLQALNQSKTELADDPIISAIMETVNNSIASFEAELASIYEVDFREAWLLELANISLEYFNASDCSGFQDCVLYATSILYDVYEDTDIPEIETIQQVILDIELVFIELFQNESSTIPETVASVNTISSNVSYLSKTDPFCSQAPYFNSIQEDVVVLLGTNVSLLCDALGNPFPTFWWYKKGVLIENEHNAEMTIFNALDNDSAIYTCEAGNVVANITSRDVSLLVLTHDDDECLISNGACEHECVNTIGSFRCLCEAGYQLNDDGFTCYDGVGTAETEALNVAVMAACLAVLALILVTAGGIFVYFKFCKGKRTKVESFHEECRKDPMHESTPVVDVDRRLGPEKNVFNVHRLNNEQYQQQSSIYERPASANQLDVSFVF